MRFGGGAKIKVLILTFFLQKIDTNGRTYKLTKLSSCSIIIHVFRKNLI